MRYYTKSVSFKGLQYVVKDRNQDDKTVYITRSFAGAQRKAKQLNAEAANPKGSQNDS